MPLAALVLVAGLALSIAGYSPREPKPRRLSRIQFARPLTRDEAILLLTPAASLAIY